MIDKIKYYLRKPLQLPINLITKLPYFNFIKDTSTYQCHVNFSIWFSQKILNKEGNRQTYWPVSTYSQVFDAQNIYAGVDTCPGLMKGCYIQGKGGIYIGNYTQIAPNVVIVSANHDLYDTRKHKKNKVIIGEYSWIGAGAKIMPGVHLGDHTIVGAGAVVTKSFKNGYCLIAGNPAKIIKHYEKDKFKKYSYDKEYYGYLNKTQFTNILNENNRLKQLREYYLLNS